MPPDRLNEKQPVKNGVLNDSFHICKNRGGWRLFYQVIIKSVTRKGSGVVKMVKHDIVYYLISLSRNFSRMVDKARAENGQYAERELHQGAP
jgi:hypothetical protein